MRKSIVIIALVFTSFLQAEVINEVVAIIGHSAITSIDIDNRIKRDLRLKGSLLYKIRRKRKILRSRALDLLISEEVVDVIAQKETIQISPARLDEEIKNRMQMSRAKNKKAFMKIIKKQTGMDFFSYKLDLAKSLKRNEVMRLKVQTKPPSEEEMKKWFRKNYKKFPGEFKLRVIERYWKRGSDTDELRISNIMGKARKMAKRSFARAARKYSRHSSKRRGGLIGFIRIDELAKKDQLIAGIIDNMAKRRMAKLSQVIRDPKNPRYLIVKLVAQKKAKIKNYKKLIQNVIMRESQQTNFLKWVKDERKNLGTKILWQGYREK